MRESLQAIEAAFLGCLQRPDASREEYVDAIEDPSIRDRVRRLLRQHEIGPGLLDEVDVVPTLVARLEAEEAAERAGEDLSGTEVGQYRFDEKLSSGGMGTVYRARARLEMEGIERQVAIKVLHREAGGAGDGLERFGREQRLLAGLHHDNIVAFLDVGCLLDGRPFLVMEYVEGASIVAACQGLETAARLALFLEVLAAVEHAHSHGIVHADLKPENILVSAQGRVRLVDFGIASIGGGEPGQAPLTPACTSPEQLAGAPATTRSDVFVLGLVLRDCLQVAGRGLAREPAAIIARATAPIPAERYASVAAFAADVRACLSGDPVAAVDAGVLYHACRHARRRPVLSLALLATLLGVGALVLGLEWGRRAARAEASRGWGAHRQAKAAVEVLEAWIVTAASRDPAAARAAALAMESRLNNGDFAALPETEGLLRLALAGVWTEVLEEPGRARPHLDRARALVSSGNLSPAELRRIEALESGG